MCNELQKEKEREPAAETWPWIQSLHNINSALWWPALRPFSHCFACTLCPTDRYALHGQRRPQDEHILHSGECAGTTSLPVVTLTSCSSAVTSGTFSDVTGKTGPSSKHRSRISYDFRRVCCFPFDSQLERSSFWSLQVELWAEEPKQKMSALISCNLQTADRGSSSGWSWADFEACRPTLSRLLWLMSSRCHALMICEGVFTDLFACRWKPRFSVRLIIFTI